MKTVQIEAGEIAATITDLKREIDKYKKLYEVEHTRRVAAEEAIHALIDTAELCNVDLGDVAEYIVWQSTVKIMEGK